MELPKRCGICVAMVAAFSPPTLSPVLRCDRNSSRTPESMKPTKSNNPLLGCSLPWDGPIFLLRVMLTMIRVCWCLWHIRLGLSSTQFLVYLSLWWDAFMVLCWSWRVTHRFEERVGSIRKSYLWFFRPHHRQNFAWRASWKQLFLHQNWYTADALQCLWRNWKSKTQVPNLGFGHAKSYVPSPVASIGMASNLGLLLSQFSTLYFFTSIYFPFLPAMSLSWLKTVDFVQVSSAVAKFPQLHCVIWPFPDRCNSIGKKEFRASTSFCLLLSLLAR